MPVWDEGIVRRVLAEGPGRSLTVYEIARRTQPYMGRTADGKPRQAMGERRVTKALMALRAQGEARRTRSWDTPYRWRLS